MEQTTETIAVKRGRPPGTGGRYSPRQAPGSKRATTRVALYLDDSLVVWARALSLNMSETVNGLLTNLRDAAEATKKAQK